MGAGGPKEDGVAEPGAQEKMEREPGPERRRSGSRGPREERGSKDTSTKRTGQYFPRHMTLSYQAPHKPVSKTTLARWLRQVLNASGVPEDVVLGAAGWSSE